MKGISVYLVVLNEEHTIRRVLESVKECQDIVVVDSGSADKTLNIVKEYTDRIYHRDWEGMATQKEYAKNLCQNDWVLNLDADEELTPALKAQIVELVQADQVNGAHIPIREHFLGRKVHAGTKKNTHVRLFKKQLGAYGTERFHETPVVPEPLATLTGEINHYGEVSVAVKVEKTNRYSSGKALDKHEKGKTSNLLKLVLVFPVMFIKSYVMRRNFLNGRRGFISSMVNAFYAFLKEAKLYELDVADDQ